MENVKLLFKKDFAERFSSTFKRQKGKSNVFGGIATFLLLAILYGTFIFVFYRFAKMYLSMTFETASAVKSRAYELLTMIYGAVIVVNVLVGIKNIYTALSESKDVEVLICQPISSSEIFAYKLIKIYLSQVFSTLLIVVPSCVIVAVLSSLGNGGYYVAMVSHLIIAPLLSCAIASLIAIPFNFLMRFIAQRFVLHLIVYIGVLAVGFWIYSLFLEQLTSLIQSGELKFVFDKLTIEKIATVTASLYPVNLFANMLLGQKLALSISVVLAIGIIGSVVSVLIIKQMYNKLLQKRMEGQNKIRKMKTSYKMRSPLGTLLYKELLVILRTPSYAFQYFATAFTLPFMVYVCVKLMQSMMQSLTFVQCDYEIAIFVIAMFSVLTNTFCTTNMSRDGKMFEMMKTFPVDGKTIVWCKVLFCIIVSIVSVIASAVVLACVGFLNWWQTIVIIIFASMLSFSEIAFSTRKDLNKPTLPESDKDEVEEGNNTVSAIIFLGLIVSILMGAGAVALSLLLSISSSSLTALAVSMTFVGGLVIIIFTLSFIYLVKGLNRKYYQTSGY